MEGGAGEEPQVLAQSGDDDVRERGERDALSRLHGLDRECRREMALGGVASR